MENYCITHAYLNIPFLSDITRNYLHHGFHTKEFSTIMVMLQPIVTQASARKPTIYFQFQIIWRYIRESYTVFLMKSLLSGSERCMWNCITTCQCQRCQEHSPLSLVQWHVLSAFCSLYISLVMESGGGCVCGGHFHSLHKFPHKSLHHLHLSIFTCSRLHSVSMLQTNKFHSSVMLN